MALLNWDKSLIQYRTRRAIRFSRLTRISRPMGWLMVIKTTLFGPATGFLAHVCASFLYNFQKERPFYFAHPATNGRS
jgi:uncharacterized membrane protein